MGAHERRKGATFEREIARQLTDELGTIVQRKLGQARDGGCDLTEIGPFVLECKRRASIAVYPWYEQVSKAANQPGQIPTVIMRGDGKKTLVVLSLDDFIPLMRGEVIG